MPLIDGAGITKAMRPFMMRIENGRIGIGGSDGSISLFGLFLVDGLVLVI